MLPNARPSAAAREFTAVGVTPPADQTHITGARTQILGPSPLDDRASSSSSSTPSVTPMPFPNNMKPRPALYHKISSDESPAQPTKPMMTITQDMLSNLSDYTGIVTHDLEVPELQDLDFNKVRSTLAKLQLPPTALESVGSWDTESESSLSSGSGPMSRPQQGDGSRSDNLEFSRPLSAHVQESNRLDREANGNIVSSLLRNSPGLLPMDHKPDFEMSREFMGSKASVGNNRLSPPLLPEGLVAKKPLFISHSPVASETPAFGDGMSPQDEQDVFWDDIEIEVDSFVKSKGWNRNVVNRAVFSGRGGGPSRIQREVVPLKDFIALPSKIPRLCRVPGDTSRPVTPAATLSRAVSIHVDRPLRTITTKSSLPRLKRPCTTSKSLLSGPFPSPSLLGGSSPAPSTTLVSQASASGVDYVSSSRRSSLQSRDSLPSFKASSLAMHLVSFIDPQDHQSKEDQILQPKKETAPPKSRPNQSSGGLRSLLELRFLTSKLDFTRTRFFSRAVPPIAEPPMDYSSTIETLKEQPSLEDEVNTPSQESSIEVLPRTGSSTWNSETVNGYYSLSRKASRSLEHRMASANDHLTNGNERVPRRLFLKRSTRPSVFGDGSELDQLDNLPTFELNGYREDYWTPKPRITPQEQIQALSIMDVSNERLEESPRPVSPSEESTTGEPTAPSMIRRTRSLRRSLFDIFGPNQGTGDDSSEKSRRRSLVGPTLKRYLSQSKLRATPEIEPIGNEDPWQGDGRDTQHRQESQETDHYFSRPRRPFVHPASPPHSIPSAFHPFGATNRPALITNMNQYMKKPRGQPHAVGKMIFDHEKMCWIINPDYLAHKRRHVSGEDPVSPVLDETWGDEPNVFADLSEDSDSSLDEDEVGPTELRGLGIGTNSFDSRTDRGLSHQPWSLRRPSQECSVANDTPMNTLRPGSSMEGPEDRLSGSMQGHTIIPKSSRKSLSAGHFGGVSNGMGGGGYSSRGEFEVGTEFDITASLLEQCMQAEAQHRKEAGKFFALPCGPSPLTKKPTRKLSSNLLRLSKGSTKSPTKSNPAKIPEPIIDYEERLLSTVGKAPVAPSLAKSWPLRSRASPATPTLPFTIEELSPSPVKKVKENGFSSPIKVKSIMEGSTILTEQPLRRTFGRATLLAALRAKPTGFQASTMAERGPTRTRHSHCGALPFSATLAIAQRGRTISRGGIPAPWEHPSFESKRSSFDKVTEMDRIHEEKDDFIERGYQLLSTVRGRPPMLSQMELMRQFEECATKYHRRHRIGTPLFE
ncbi:hypothetical protein BGW38_008917 [Lunasporangiospora selenospora]|uniref:Uncharacterized protein n=1 Tax=Lunasporangiospora selenospora TaxID=979761 RepID=A0A9P6KGD6_9FUNG|nr:hypothetical protein BGW38_008917 [Lunasporangiospora selenospora]